MNSTQVEYSKYLFYPYLVRLKDETSSWKPTPHGIALANAMTSIASEFQGKSVLEIGAGSGIHAILANKFGCQYIDITEIESTFLDAASENAKLNNCSFRNAMIQDWTDFTPTQSYDILICNPPFCKAGTKDRRWFIQQLIKDGKKFLSSSGFFIFCQSSMADFKLTESEIKCADSSFDVILEHKGLFRDYYFTEPGFMEESNAVTNGFEMIDDAYVETLRAYRVRPN